MGKQFEIRNVQADEIRVNKDGDTSTLEGYVTKFDEPSQLIAERGRVFYETVNHNAFDSTLESDSNIYALYNHDWNRILGSTQNESLELHTDDVGLRFTLNLKANTSYANDVKELVKAGEIRGCSFGFTVKKDKWKRKEDENYRELLDVDLKEVTITGLPAYEQSEVSCRSYDSFIEELEQRNKDLKLLELELDLIKLINKIE